MTKPTVTHIKYIDREAKWKTKTFLPIFDDRLVWCMDVKNSFCSDCPLATFAHPMVTDKLDHNLFHKLCTLSVLKLGLISLQDVEGVPEKGDFRRVKELLAKLVKVPINKNIR